MVRSIRGPVHSQTLFIHNLRPSPLTTGFAEGTVCWLRLYPTFPALAEAAGVSLYSAMQPSRGVSYAHMREVADRPTSGMCDSGLACLSTGTGLTLACHNKRAQERHESAQSVYRKCDHVPSFKPLRGTPADLKPRVVLTCLPISVCQDAAAGTTHVASWTTCATASLSSQGRHHAVASGASSTGCGATTRGNANACAGSAASHDAPAVHRNWGGVAPRRGSLLACLTCTCFRQACMGCSLARRSQAAEGHERAASEEAQSMPGNKARRGLHEPGER